MSVWRALSSLSFLLLISTHVFSTSVVVIETDQNVIFVAADSLVRWTQDGRPVHICKIHRSGSTYWAASSGFYQTTDGFSLEAIMSSIGTEGTIAAKMQRLTDALKVLLPRQLALLEITDPMEFRTYLDGPRAAVEMLFVGVEHGKPKWAVTRYFVKRVQGILTIFPEREEMIPPPLANGVGSWDTPAKYVGKHFKKFRSDALSVIKRGMEAEAAKDPGEVGSPYSILRIGPKGSRWLEEGECKGVLGQAGSER